VESPQTTDHMKIVTDAKTTPADEPSQVFPYRSYSYNNYFGDFELIGGGKPRPRCSTVRCEAPESLCLVLAKDDFASICERFPQYASPWQVLGRRRNWFRTRQRRLLLHGLSLKGISALRIQRYWQASRKNTKPHSGKQTAKHNMELVFSMRPPNKDDDPAQVPSTTPMSPRDNSAPNVQWTTCSRNGQCCEDVNVLRTDIQELKDTMSLMVKEVAALNRAVQSTRGGASSTSHSCPAGVADM
jgi:hypothetical protein